MMEQIGTYGYYQNQRERFRTGELVEAWYKLYPQIFDEKDYRIARNQANMGYHFFEWLAAIILYHTWGFYCLVEQYEFKLHKRKQGILKKILTEEVYDLVTNHKTEFKGVQCPDLFVYSPDYAEWFFCEVKGQGDRPRKVQTEFFNALSDMTYKPVRVIQFKLSK